MATLFFGSCNQPPGDFTVTVVPGSGELFVSWTESTRAETYRIYLNHDDANEGSGQIGGDIAGSITSFLITGLTNETPYVVMMQALNGSGVTEVEAGTFTPTSNDISYEYLVSSNQLAESSGGPAIVYARSGIRTHRDPLTGRVHYLTTDRHSMDGMRLVQNFASTPSTPATQVVTLRASQYTVQVSGTAGAQVIIAGSGATTATAVTGTTQTWDSTSGSTTFTVVGSPLFFQIEVGASANEKVSTFNYYAVGGVEAALNVDVLAGPTPLSGGRVNSLMSVYFGCSLSAQTSVRGPDGSFWPRVIESIDAVASTHYIRHTCDVALSLTSVVPRTWALDVGAGSTRSLKININTLVGAASHGGQSYGTFNTSAMAWTTTGGGTYGNSDQIPTLIGVSAISYSAYSRIWMTYTLPVKTYAAVYLEAQFSNQNTTNYTGTGAFVYTDNWQLDNALYPSAFQDFRDGARDSESVYIDISAIDDASECSIYTRMYIQDTDSARPLVALDNSSSALMVVSADDHYVATMGSLTMSCGAVTGGWHKYVGTFKNSAQHACVDAVSIGAVVTSTSTVSKGAATKAYIGRNKDGSVRQNCKLEHFRIDADIWTTDTSLQLTLTPTASTSSAPSTVLDIGDSRIESWVDPRLAFSAYSGKSYTINHFSNGIALSALPEPGVLARSGGGVSVAGVYTFQRNFIDPTDSTKRAFYHKVSQGWDTNSFYTTTYRSELAGGETRGDPILEGGEYWIGTAYYFYPDCLGHNGDSLDTFDLHEQNYSPSTSGVGALGAVMNTMILSGNAGSGSDRYYWRHRYDSGSPPYTAAAGSIDLDIVNATGSIPPADTWVYVVRKVKLHWDVTQAPYSIVWCALGNGALQQVSTRTTGINAINLANPRYFPKFGAYKWSTTWGTKTTRTMLTKGLYIAEALAPQAGEPVIDENVMLATLRSV